MTDQLINEVQSASDEVSGHTVHTVPQDTRPLSVLGYARTLSFERARTRTHTHIHKHTHTLTNTHTHTHTYTHSQTGTHTHSLTHTHTHTHTNRYTRTHAHTHTNTRAHKQTHTERGRVHTVTSVKTDRQCGGPTYRPRRPSLGTMPGCYSATTATTPLDPPAD